MKLPKKLRNLAALTALVSTSLSFGCGNTPTGLQETQENNRPETYIDNHSITGPSQYGTYQLQVEGHGNDPDEFGYIRGFQYSLDNYPWSDIIFTAGSFSRTMTVPSSGNHNFKLRAIDDAGEEDLSPALINFSTGGVQHKTTDQNGLVEFSNGKEIRIKDYDTSLPVSGMEVAYLPTEEYNVISVRGPNHIAHRKLSTGLDLENITIKNSSHENEIRYMYGEEKELREKFLRDLMNGSLSDRINCSDYQQTNSGTNEAAATLALEGILMYFGVNDIIEIAGEAIRLLDEDVIAPPTLVEILTNNWDHYEVDSPMWEGEKSFIRIKSNKPTISLDNLTIDNSNASLVFSGEDRTTYDIPVSGVIEDKTITCRGPTPLADKLYSWILYSPSGTSSGSTQQQVLNLDFSNLEPGEHTIEVDLFDDTKWKDEYNDLGTNGDYFETTFNISGGLETLVLQPGPEGGKDASIYSGYPDANDGNNDTVFIMYDGQHNDIDKFLIQFNVPEGLNVTNATLSIFGEEIAHNYVNPLRIRRITTPWSEHEVTWNNKPLKSSTIHGTIYAPNDYEWMEKDITELVQGWSNGTYSNYGVYIEVDNPGHNEAIGAIISTSDEANPYGRPKLTIKYQE